MRDDFNKNVKTFADELCEGLEDSLKEIKSGLAQYVTMTPSDSSTP